MFRSIFSIVVLVLTSLAVPAGAQLAWDGGGDGSSWSDPLNWSADAVPTSNDDVRLDGGVTVTLDVSAQITDLTLDDATVQGSADLTVTGVLDWRLGTHAGSGTWTMTGSALLAENTTKTIHGRVVFACDVVWQTSTILFAPTGSVEHLAGFTLDVVTGPSKALGHEAAPLLEVDPTADDSNVYVFTMGGASFFNFPVRFGVSTRQAGTLTASADLDFDSGSEFTGTSSLGDGVRLDLGYGSHRLAGSFASESSVFPQGIYVDGNQTTVHLGAGFLVVDTVDLNVSGPIVAEVDVPRIGLDGGVLELFDGTKVNIATFEGTQNAIIAYNAARFVNELTLNTQSPTTISGTIEVEGTATVNGSGLLLDDASEVQILDGATLEWNSSTTGQAIAPSSGSAGLRIDGEWIVRSGSAMPRVFVATQFRPGSQFTVEAGADIRFDADSDFEGAVDLQGTLRLRDGVHTLSDPNSFIGPGGIELQSDAILDFGGIADLGVDLDLQGTVRSTTSTTLTGNVTLAGGTLEGPGDYVLTGTNEFLPINPLEDHVFASTTVRLDGATTWSDADIVLVDSALRVSSSGSFLIDHQSSGLALEGTGASLLDVQGSLEVRNHLSVPPRIEVPYQFDPTSQVRLGMGSVFTELDLRGSGQILGSVDIAFGTTLRVSSGTTLLGDGSNLTGEGTLMVDTGGTLEARTDLDVKTSIRGEVTTTEVIAFTRPTRVLGGSFSGGGTITAQRGLEFDPDSSVDANEILNGTTLVLDGISTWRRGDLGILGGSRVVVADLGELHVAPAAGDLTVRQDASTSQPEVLQVDGLLSFEPGVGVAPGFEAELQTTPGSRVTVDPGVTLTLRGGGRVDGELFTDGGAKARVLFQGLFVPEGGTLTGFGTLEPSLGGSIDLDGTLAPGSSDQAGTLTVNGPMSWSATSRVDLDAFSATEVDDVQLGGSHTIAGALDLIFDDPDGYAFDGALVAITGASILGTFGSVNVPSNPNISVAADYSPTAVTLDVVPQSANIAGVIFEDADVDGSQDTGEPGLSGWTVDLVQEGAVVATTLTDESGRYAFSELSAPAIYQVRPELPSGWLITTFVIPGLQGVYAPVAPGEASVVDVGLSQENGRVRGTVVHDIDDDGLLDVFDPALRGVEVTATGVDVPAVFRTTTNEDGNFAINLPAGTYTIEAVPFSGWGPAFPIPTPVLEVTVGASIDNVFLGLESPRRSVRGIVYLDVDANGEFDRLDDPVLSPEFVRVEQLGSTNHFVGAAVGAQYGTTIGYGEVLVSHPDTPLRVLTPPGGRLRILGEEFSGKDIVQDFGLVSGSVLSGTVFLDRDGTPGFDVNADVVLTDYLVRISDVGDFRTDENGGFSTLVEPGTYTVRLLGPGLEQVDDILVEIGSNEAIDVEVAARYSATYVLSGLGDSGPGTLRAAIEAVNAGDASAIEFGTAGEVALSSALPSVTRTVYSSSANAPKLDGPLISVRGDGCGDCDGLVIESDGNYLSGLRFEGFSGDGIVIEGDDNLLTGVAAERNGGAGVRIAGGERVRIRDAAFRENALGAIDHDGLSPAIPALQYGSSDGSTVTGSIQGAPFAFYDIEVYANTNCTESGPAESLAGSVGVEADELGHASFSVPVVGPSDYWTATATEFGASTSEVSVCLDMNVTSVEPTDVPSRVLHRAFPNPSQGPTRIAFALPEAEAARVRVYDVRGRVVRTLQEGTLRAGRHVLIWDGTDSRGSEVGAGIYFYQILVGSERYTQKFARVR